MLADGDGRAELRERGFDALRRSWIGLGELLVPPRDGSVVSASAAREATSWILSQAVRAPVRVQYTRQDEMQWENYGAACALELRAVLGSDGTIAAWDREAWVAALGSRPGYDRPGNIITGMLLGHEPEPLAIGPAEPPKGKLDNRSNALPPYLAGCVAGACGGDGTIRRACTSTTTCPRSRPCS